MTEAEWVTDTSVITHLFRAGYGELLMQLAPGSIVVVPAAVDREISAGKHRYRGMPDLNSLDWVRRTELDDDEEWIALGVKADMGGGADEHMGECAVIAVAKNRGLVALLDERAAIIQADRRQVVTRDTLWLVIEAYGTVFGRRRAPAEAIVDALLAIDKKLPVGSGEELISWAYRQGYLPREDETPEVP